MEEIFNPTETLVSDLACKNACISQCKYDLVIQAINNYYLFIILSAGLILLGLISLTFKPILKEGMKKYYPSIDDDLYDRMVKYIFTFGFILMVVFMIMFSMGLKIPFTI